MIVKLYECFNFETIVLLIYHLKNLEKCMSVRAKKFHFMVEIIGRLKFFVGCNRRNLVKLVTKIITDENYHRRKYWPTKIIPIKVFVIKVSKKAINLQHDRIS